MHTIHLSPEHLVDYFSGLWTIDQELAIETHIAECGICATLARQIYSEAFIMDEWNSVEHGRVLRASQQKSMLAASHR